MKIIPAKPEHFELLDLRDVEADELGADSAGLEKALALVDISTAATISYNGCVLAIMGYYQLWPGVLEVWVLPSKYVQNHAVPYLRTVRRYIEGLSKLPGVHRLQTSAVDDSLHEGWMRFLGFQCEGLLRSYSSNKVDYAMWGRLGCASPE